MNWKSSKRPKSVFPQCWSSTARLPFAYQTKTALVLPMVMVLTWKSSIRLASFDKTSGSMGRGRPIWTSVVLLARVACTLRPGSINSGRHLLAFTMRRALRKQRVFDFVPRYLNRACEIELNFLTACNWTISMKFGTLVQHAHGYNDLPHFSNFCPGT